MIFEFSLKMIVIRIASVKQEVDIDALTLCGRVMAYVFIVCFFLFFFRVIKVFGLEILQSYTKPLELKKSDQTHI